jgi:hypothetical protein
VIFVRVKVTRGETAQLFLWGKCEDKRWWRYLIGSDIYAVEIRVRVVYPSPPVSSVLASSVLSSFALPNPVFLMIPSCVGRFPSSRLQSSTWRWQQEIWRGERVDDGAVWGWRGWGGRHPLTSAACLSVKNSAGRCSTRTSSCGSRRRRQQWPLSHWSLYNTTLCLAAGPWPPSKQRDGGRYITARAGLWN